MFTIQEQMSMELDIRGYTRITKRNYLYHINRFLDLSAVPLEELDQSHPKLYLHQLYSSGLSFSWMNIAYSAIKFMFIHCLNRDWDLSKLPRPKNPVKLPKFLSPSEVLAVLNATHNLKHRAILSTVYSAGLRVSEVVNLRISDIHSDSMQIFVNLGKGAKDRYTLLSEANLLLLRKFFKKYRPTDYLFTNDYSGLPLSTATVQRVFRESLAAAGIDRKLSVHCLRHSFATDTNPQDYFFALINQLYSIDWVVYAKPTFKHSSAVLKYLGRYTHRIAISNSRILSMNNGLISFKYKDYKDDNRQKVMTLSAGEFIRRFLMHVLPCGFRKIRHYGLLSNCVRKKKITLVRKLIGVSSFLSQLLLETQEPFQPLCPICKQGHLVFSHRVSHVRLLS